LSEDRENANSRENENKLLITRLNRPILKCYYAVHRAGCIRLHLELGLAIDQCLFCQCRRKIEKLAEAARSKGDVKATSIALKT